MDFAVVAINMYVCKCTYVYVSISIYFSFCVCLCVYLENQPDFKQLRTLLCFAAQTSLALKSFVCLLRIEDFASQFAIGHLLPMTIFCHFLMLN